LARGLFFRHPVAFLIFAGELIALTRELALWIMGEPAQLFFHYPAYLPAVAFETIPIHPGLRLLSTALA